LRNIKEYILAVDVRWLKNTFVIFFSQIVIIGFFSFFFYFTKDKITGVSVITGGLTYCVPTLFAGIFMSRASDKSAPLALLKGYLGELYKIIITICLFIYIFKNIPIEISIFLIAYGLMFVMQSVMSFVVNKSN
jgi:F0F1-type ATP synthase assembly protein I